MSTIKLPVIRCKHEAIKAWCVECSGDDRAKEVTRILKGKPVKRKKPLKGRKNNGQFDYSLGSKMLNMFFILSGAIITLISGFSYVYETPTTRIEFASPLSTVHAVGPIPSPTPTPEMDPVEREIREVFGEYAEDALKIARCESRLDPKAVNDNRTWGGVGVDRGVFQQNSVYHPADKKFVEDPEIAIKMAYNIFEEAGFKWTPWVCRWVLED